MKRLNLLGGLLLLPALAWAQPAGRTPEPGILYVEPLALPGPDSLHNRVDVLFRIDRSYFVAVREDEPGAASPFRRRGEIAVELIGEDGITRARDIERIEVGDADAERTPDHRVWIEGAMTFTVPSGTYTLLVQTEDLESRRATLDKSRTVRVPSFQGRDLQIAGPLFIHPSHRTADSSIVGPINAGGDLLFGAPASLYCEVVSPAPPGTPVFVSYSIAEVEGGKTEAPVLQDSLAGLAPDSAGVLTLPRAHASAHYVVRPGPRRGVALVIPFPAERLMLRPMKLTLRIRQGSWEQTVVRPFRMVWPEMPYSLRDVDYALDMLRYITTGRELDSLESGGYETRRANLEEFWRRKDPTPGTAMNDVMTEYYRRVDHSMRSFASLRQPDGARTDRGKIYILYGPPSRVDRALDPREGFRETWSYERLGREFVFADASKNGVYVLAPSPQP